MIKTGDFPMSQPDSMKTKPPEMIVVAADADQVSCDGGGGSLGHPLVYYTFDGRDTVECGYCDRAFARRSA